MHAASSSMLFTTLLLALLIICSQQQQLTIIAMPIMEQHHHELVLQVKEEATVRRRICGTQQRILTVSGAPTTVEVQAAAGVEGDALIAVRFVNRGSHQVAVHWDGGVPGTNNQQCPIPICPGNSYAYRFFFFTVAGQEAAGTLWYRWHAHSSCLRATVHGALLIRPRAAVPAAYPFNGGKPPASWEIIPIILENCWEFPKVHPFCLKPLCKGNCYLEAKSQGVNLGGYHCDGNGFWGMCVCWFCKH